MKGGGQSQVLESFKAGAKSADGFLVFLSKVVRDGHRIRAQHLLDFILGVKKPYKANQVSAG